MTMLALGLIQPHTTLDYLPPCAGLTTSSADHPMKTKSQMNMQVSKPDFTVCPEPNSQGRKFKLITSSDKHTYVFDQQATVFSQPGMRPSTEHKTCYKAESCQVQLTPTDQVRDPSSTHVKILGKYFK